MLGKKSDGTGIADGVAPEAKLAFCDIGTKRGFLRLPPNDLLLETGRVDGMETIAHIHSASWGAEFNYYDYQARQFDDILYDWSKRHFCACILNSTVAIQLSLNLFTCAILFRF